MAALASHSTFKSLLNDIALTKLTEHRLPPLAEALESFSSSDMKTSNTFDILTYAELEEAVENDATDSQFKTAATFLHDAVQDWPTTGLTEPIDLISELKKDVGQDLTFGNLSRFTKTSIQEGRLWKAEAVSALLELFDFERKSVFDQTTTLEAIIDRLTKHYRNK